VPDSNKNFEESSISDRNGISIVR